MMTLPPMRFVIARDSAGAPDHAVAVLNDDVRIGADEIEIAALASRSTSA
jgi:hypothetical protein